MALHTQLPIYKVAYDLFDVIVDLAKNMPRDFKQAIGGKLRDECIDIMTFVFRANTFCYDVEDEEYPKEWTYDKEGYPCCTAFVAAGDPIPMPRCEKTIDMFGGAA